LIYKRAATPRWGVHVVKRLHGRLIFGHNKRTLVSERPGAQFQQTNP